MGFLRDHQALGIPKPLERLTNVPDQRCAHLLGECRHGLGHGGAGQIPWNGGIRGNIRRCNTCTWISTSRKPASHEGPVRPAHHRAQTAHGCWPRLRH